MHYFWISLQKTSTIAILILPWTTNELIVCFTYFLWKRTFVTLTKILSTKPMDGEILVANYIFIAAKCDALFLVLRFHVCFSKCLEYNIEIEIGWYISSKMLVLSCKRMIVLNSLFLIQHQKYWICHEISG